MKHAILGAGAIGGLLGTALASLGEDVALVVRAEKLAGYPKDLVLERPTGKITAAAHVVARRTTPTDALWIATKTYQLESALATVESEPRYVIPLLNGVDHVPMLRERYGNDQTAEARVIPATIAVEAERTAPGRFIQRSPFVRLNLAASGESAFGSILSRLSELGFSCQFIANEQTLLWNKLCFLGPFALSTSASGLSIGGVLESADSRAKLKAAIGEACAVAIASGAQIDEAKIWSAVENSPPEMRSSMQKDVVAGRQLELDDIGGAIVRAGARNGIDVPATKGLMETIRAKTAAA
jgi:2-dehydropantoate 2-reductase